MRKYVFLFLVSCFLCCLLVFPFTVLASDANGNIRVTGFSFDRSISPLLDSDGDPFIHPAGPNYGADILGNNLQGPWYFGQGNLVECPVQFAPPVDYIERGLLVDDNGVLLFDLFFASTTSQDLEAEEVEELKRFLENGGVVYVAANTHNNSGLSYHPLFEALGIEERFSSVFWNVGRGIRSLDTAGISPVMNGEFGNVLYIRFSGYRQLDPITMVGMVVDPVNNEYLVSEYSYGLGYLSVSGSPIHVNVLMSSDNRKYFLNLFALGCWERPERLINVPLMKQVNEVWREDEYDSGNIQNLWCGDTIAECGCAMSSAAMVLKYYGVEKGLFHEDVTPKALNDFLSLFPHLYTGVDKNGNPYRYYTTLGYTWGDIVWEAVGWYSLFAKDEYPEQPIMDRPIRENYNLNRLKGYLDEGTAVLLKVVTPRGGYHWVVVKGYDGDNLLINDPVRVDEPGFREEYNLTTFGYVPAMKNSMVIFKEAHTDYSSIEIRTVAPARVVVTGADGQVVGEEVFSEAYEDVVGDNPVAPEGEGVYSWIVDGPETDCYEVDLEQPEGADYGLTIYATTSEGRTVFTSRREGGGFCYDPESEEVLLFERGVGIDIKPGSEENPINVSSMGVIPVVIWGEEDFEVGEIDADSVVFGPGEAKKVHKKAHIQDVNDDGRVDLLFHFWVSESGIGEGGGEVCLEGETHDGLKIKGCDKVGMVPNIIGVLQSSEGEE